jgi:CHRD domain
MRIRYALPVAILLGLGIASLAIASTRDHGKGSQNNNQFTAFLNGHNETPAMHTNGTGKLTLTINSNNTMSYSLTYSGLSGAVAAAHVHLAQPNVAGGVVFFLCGGGGKPSCPAGGTPVTGTISAADILSPTNPYQGINAGDFAGIVQEIRAGFTYANVHTASFPGGEIRGQLGSNGHDEGDDEDDD